MVSRTAQLMTQLAFLDLNTRPSPVVVDVEVDDVLAGNQRIKRRFHVDAIVLEVHGVQKVVARGAPHRPGEVVVGGVNSDEGLALAEVQHTLWRGRKGLNRSDEGVILWWDNLSVRYCKIPLRAPTCSWFRAMKRLERGLVALHTSLGKVPLSRLSLRMRC